MKLSLLFGSIRCTQFLLEETQVFTVVNSEYLLVIGLLSLEDYCNTRNCNSCKDEIRDILQLSISDDAKEARIKDLLS